MEDAIRLPVFDGENKRVGTLYDISVTKTTDYPRANCLAITVDEAEIIGNYRLVKPARDIVVAVSWQEVAEFRTDRVLLKSPWREIPLHVWGKEDIFVRRDILNLQVLDKDGHRVQRVDDLILEQREGDLYLAGIYIGFGGRLKRLNLARAAQHLLKTLGIKMHEHMLPWASVETYGPGFEEIRLNVGVKKRGRF